MKRFVQWAVAVAIVGMPLAAGAHHHLKHSFYVYDLASHAPIDGAIVTVSYEDGIQSGETGSPRGSVQFRLPGEYEFVEVAVDAEGYCSVNETLRLGFRPNVGGRGIWVGLHACAPGR